MSASGRPAGVARLSARPGPVTMSPSDSAAMTLRARWAAVRLWASARPRSCSAARARWPFFGPDGTSAGFAPMKAGVSATGCPGTSVKLSDR